MKERGILFSSEMVKAILAGTKHVTRRAVKFAWDDWNRDHSKVSMRLGRDGAPCFMEGNPDSRLAARIAEGDGKRCPYGAPGDRLWVRETFRVDGWDAPDEAQPHAEIGYRADGSSRRLRIKADDLDAWVDKQARQIRREGGILTGDGWSLDRERAWRPAIFLERWMSRITLDVLSIRVERLHDISEEDAIAEGIERVVVGTCDLGWRNYLWHGDHEITRAQIDSWPHQFSTYSEEKRPDPARQAFGSLWARINGAGSWAANPWVWRIEFRRVTP